MPTLTDRFTERLHDLGSDGGRRFVHGVYKQIVESQRGRRTQGEYRAAFDSSDLSTGKGAYENLTFIFHLADALYQQGLPRHAERLLGKERVSDDYVYWRRGITLLEEADPDWKSGVTARGISTGIQLITGDWDSSHQFGASIIHIRDSHGSSEGLFETSLRFDGKGLEELGYTADYTIGYMPARDALALGRAVARKDRPSMDAILAQY